MGINSLIIQYGYNGYSWVTLPIAYTNSHYAVAVGGYVSTSRAVGLSTDDQHYLTKFHLIGNVQNSFNTEGQGHWITIGY